MHNFFDQCLFPVRQNVGYFDFLRYFKHLKMTYILMYIHINSVKRLDFYALVVSVKLGL